MTNDKLKELQNMKSIILMMSLIISCMFTLGCIIDENSNEIYSNVNATVISINRFIDYQYKSYAPLIGNKYPVEMYFISLKTDNGAYFSGVTDISTINIGDRIVTKEIPSCERCNLDILYIQSKIE